MAICWGRDKIKSPINKQNLINYFAYGSNMSLARLQQRVPAARRLGVYYTEGYDLRFHMSSQDGSAKCNAYYTGNQEDLVWGVVFEIPVSGKHALDKAENLRVGYTDKLINTINEKG